jgi:hypothetical protein
VQATQRPEPIPYTTVPREGLKRAFLGWLRGAREHWKMAAIPTIAEEDAPHRRIAAMGWKATYQQESLAA